MKQTVGNTAKLASNILRGYDPSRKEIETLALTVLFQHQAARQRAAEKIIAEEIDARERRAAESKRRVGILWRIKRLFHT